MKVTAVNPETGEMAELEVGQEMLEQLKNLSNTSTDQATLNRHIDNLDISADAKLLMTSIGNQVIRAGELVINIGRKIIEAVLFIASQIPNASIGFLLGLIVGALIGSVPLIGWILGPFATVIASVFGIVVGGMQDIKDRAIARQIDLVRAEFDILKGEVSVASE